MKLRHLVALAAALTLVFGASGIAFAAVSTDQADYSPGSTVTISGDNSDGAGYLAGETVHVDVSGPNGYSAACDATVTDDSGSWSCQVTLNADDSAIGDYTYTASGAESEVSQSGTFTDGETQCTPAGESTWNCGINPDHVGATNPGFKEEDCSKVYPELAVPAAPNDWGWEFVTPEGTFVSLTVTFANAGTIGPVSPIVGSNSWPDAKHIYLFTAEGDTLVSASAVISNSDDPTKFNLSHVCEGTDGGGGAESTISTTVHLGATDSDDAVPVSNEAPAELGSTVHDSANLTFTGGGNLPDGSSITFSFFTSNDCKGDVEDSDTIAVSGPSPVDVDPALAQGPLGAGDYSYRADLTSGDPSIVPDATGDCEPFMVARAQLGISTEIHLGDDHSTDVQDSSVALGSTIHDSATVTGLVAGFPLADPNVNFTFYGDNPQDPDDPNVGDCTDTAFDAGSAEIDASGVADGSDPQGPLHAGKYGFTASIAGDDNYVGADGTCEQVEVSKAQLGISTEIHLGDDHENDVQGTSVALGSTIHDSATVTGIVDGFAPVNDVAFFFYGSNTLGNGNLGDCLDEDPASAGSAVVDASGVADGSDSQGPLHAGSYGFKASIAGDADYEGSGLSACEPIEVSKGTVTIDTEIHRSPHGASEGAEVTAVATGTTVHDHANVTWTSTFEPSGNVEFVIRKGTICDGDQVSSEQVALGDPVISPIISSDYTTNSGNVPGISYQASYAGDADFEGTTDEECEPLAVYQLGKTMGFWGNTNGKARIIAAGGYSANAVAIGRGSNIDTQGESLKVLPNTLNACGKGSPYIFTVGAQTGTTNCKLAAGININSLNTLASQTLALGYNIKLVSGYTGQTIGALQCTAYLTAGLTGASTVNEAFSAAVGLINGSSLGGTTTQAQIGAMNQLLGCLNREA